MDDRKSVTNTPFPSSSGPQYQNEVKCSAFDVEMIFHSYASKTQFHKKGCPLGLVLKGGYLVIGITKFIDIFYFFVRVNTRNSQRFLLAVKNKNNNKQITTTTTTTKNNNQKNHSSASDGAVQLLRYDPKIKTVDSQSDFRILLLL